MLNGKKEELLGVLWVSSGSKKRGGGGGGGGGGARVNSYFTYIVLQL